MFTTISILLAALCLLPSATKLSGQPAMQASAEHFGIDWPRYRLIGVAELAAALGILAGLVWHPSASTPRGMAALLVGGLVMHVRAGNSAKDMAPALLILLVTICYLAIALSR